MKECCDLLINIDLQPLVSDMWIWHLHASKKYNATSAYHYLFTANNNLEADNTNLN